MLRQMLKTIAPMLVVTFLGASVLYAGDWQWPSQMNIGGFSVTGINGSTRADGSGTASGMLQIPGGGPERISLTRSSRGDVVGSVSLGSRISGAEITGSFSLTSSGLKGRGSIRCSSKTINDASISISSNGQFSAQTPSRAQADTPLATYKFEGVMNVQGSGGVNITASGTVRRTGKLADQVTNYSVTTSVSPYDGRGTANVGGISVTFTFF